MRQIVLQRQLLQRQIEFAGFADIQPDGAVGRVFTYVGIVTYQLKPHAVEVADKARIDRDLRLVLFAELLGGDRHQSHQFIVEIDFELRQRRNQRRRGTIAQIQQRARHHFIAAHAELNLAARFGTAQRHATGRRSDLIKHQLAVTQRRVGVDPRVHLR